MEKKSIGSKIMLKRRIPQNRKFFTFSIIDFYNRYAVEKRGTKYPQLSYEQYRKLIECFFKLIMIKVIRDNFVFAMPYSLGFVMVKSIAPNSGKVKVDYNNTKKLKKVVRHMNFHTYGWTFSIIWNKTFCQFKNRGFYKFRAIKSEKSRIAGVGKLGLKDHIMTTTKPGSKPYIKY